RLRLIYESAWGYRALAGMETALARAKAAGAQGSEPQKVPVPPSEQKARERYQALLAAGADSPLSLDAPLELAELQAERGEHEAAIKLLTEALDKEPSALLADKIRVRLGACHAARKDTKSALAQFQTVAKNPKSPLAPQAQYGAGECLLEMGQWAEAI